MHRSFILLSRTSLRQISAANLKLPVSKPFLLVAGTSVAAVALYNKSFSVKLGNSFSSSSANMAPQKEYSVQKSEQDWRVQLSPQQFRVLREKGTERPGSGEYDSKYPKRGVFNCGACSAPLYNYDSKFKSGCGWPAFFAEIPGSVDRHVDRTMGMSRTEIVCSNCGSHLGHVFKGEGYGGEADERHCVNSVSLKLDEQADAKPQKY